MDRRTMMLYHPYGLRVMLVPGYKESLLVKRLNEETYEAVDCWGRRFEIPYGTRLYKPVLYPIDYLGIPIRVNNIEVIAIELVNQRICNKIGLDESDSDYVWIKDSIQRYFNNQMVCPFPRDIMNQICFILYSLHFDLTGSIKKKEAKNVCTLSYNPYEFDDIPVL